MSLWPISGLIICSKDWNYLTSQAIAGRTNHYLKTLSTWICIVIGIIWIPHFILWGLELY